MYSRNFESQNGTSRYPLTQLSHIRTNIAHALTPLAISKH